MTSMHENASARRAASVSRPGRADDTDHHPSGRSDVLAVRPESRHTHHANVLERALVRENMLAAWRRVKADRPGVGVDGLSLRQTADCLKARWPQIRSALRNGSYLPPAVRPVAIARSEGGTRELGLSTITDRLVQQALLQVLQPLIDPSFTGAGYGLRPGWPASPGATRRQPWTHPGHRVVVDIDLEDFFDRANHALLMDRMEHRVRDPALLRLLARYLEAGILDGGVVVERCQGTTRGAPLSPLLANVLLEEVDRELEKQGHRVVRYADDRHVYYCVVGAGTGNGCAEESRMA